MCDKCEEARGIYRTWLTIYQHEAFSEEDREEIVAEVRCDRHCPCAHRKGHRQHCTAHRVDEFQWERARLAWARQKQGQVG